MSEPHEDLSPAERRARELLEVLADEPPPTGQALVPRVMRVSRRQRAARSVLAVIGSLVAAVADGVGLLVARGRSRRGDR